MKEEKYTIELTKTQLKTIRSACEFYSRFSAGQMELPLELYHKLCDNKSFLDKRNSISNLFAEIKVLTLELNRNESLAIGSKELIEEAKTCYDIYRPILELFTKEWEEQHPESNSKNVYSFPGLTYSKEGRIIIKKI